MPTIDKFRNLSVQQPGRLYGDKYFDRLKNLFSAESQHAMEIKSHAIKY